ncbi:MAG: Mur ligase family protein [Gemmatimonadota bacterium]
MSGRGPVDPATRTLLHELFPGRLAPAERWGLGKTRALLSAVGGPQRSFATVHVGGTNGKGSTSAMVASALSAAGHRVGLYTSPHLVRFNERIQVDGRPVADDVLARVADGFASVVDEVDPAFFELSTALAFKTFQELGVEIAVVEVGLGGRLDATNVLDPLAVGVTNVGLDHREYLGDTLESVAREKAGIAKRDTVFLTTASVPAVRSVLSARAEALGARVRILEPGELTVRSGEPLQLRAVLEESRWGSVELDLPLAGAHQALNLLLALRLLEALPDRWCPARHALVRGIHQTRWPGRLDLRRHDGSAWIFDIAHNPEGIEALARSLPDLGLELPLRAVVGILGDKDWRSMLEGLAPLAQRLFLTQPPSAGGRRWNLEEVAGWVATRPWADRVEVAPEFTELLSSPHLRGGTALVTGSAHTVGDAFAVLGFEPFSEWPAAPSDSDAASAVG